MTPSEQTSFSSPPSRGPKIRVSTGPPAEMRLVRPPLGDAGREELEGLTQLEFDLDRLADGLDGGRHQRALPPVRRPAASL
jgi:hypothetical protein